MGLTLNIFGLAYMDVSFSYGPSFWIFISGVVFFILLIVYEQWSMNHLEQQKMILSLIQEEKKVNQKVHREKEIELTSEGDAYI